MKKRIIALILAFLMCGTTAQASVQKDNTEAAARYAIENYGTYHLHPTTVTAILNGESAAMTANNGRPYGMIGRRYYDIYSGTEAFCELIRFSGWYGDAWKYYDWRDQLRAIQAHGYCQDGSDYLTYTYQVVETYNLDRFDDDLQKHLADKREKKAARKRAKRQMERFTLAPGKTPIGTIAADPKVLKKGSTVRIGYNYYTVEKEVAGLGNVILIGSLSSVRPGVKLDEVVEGAVG